MKTTLPKHKPRLPRKLKKEVGIIERVFIPHITSSAPCPCDTRVSMSIRYTEEHIVKPGVKSNRNTIKLLHLAKRYGLRKLKRQIEMAIENANNKPSWMDIQENEAITEMKNYADKIFSIPATIKQRLWQKK